MDTIQQISTGVRVMLRRPSELQLPEDDLRGRLMDLLRGYCRDLALSPRDRNTEKEEVQITETEIDYLLSGPVDVDFEPTRLEYEICDGENVSMAEAALIPYASWPRHYDGDRLVASIYGSANDRIAINLTPDRVCAMRWFLTYRPTLLAFLAANSPMPLPADFVPMIKTECAVMVMPLVNNNSEDWIAWMGRALPIYTADALRWNNPSDPSTPGRWQHYLISSNEPQIQPVRRSDRHRGRWGARVRPVVPAQ